MARLVEWTNEKKNVAFDFILNEIREGNSLTKVLKTDIKMIPEDFKDEFYNRGNRKSNNGYNIVGVLLPTEEEQLSELEKRVKKKHRGFTETLQTYRDDEIYKRGFIDCIEWLRKR